MLLDYVNSYLNKAVVPNPALSPGTIRNYRKSVNQFKTFLTAKGIENISANKVSSLLAVELKEYLHCTTQMRYLWSTHCFDDLHVNATQLHTKKNGLLTRFAFATDEARRGSDSSLSIYPFL